MLKVLGKAVRWYMIGLFHPLTIMLAVVVVVALYEGIISNGRTQMNIIMTLELLLYPLYFLQAALHIVRDAKTSLFELSLIKSWKILYVSRIIVFTVALLPVYLPILIILIINNLNNIVIPFTLKTLSYISILSIGILLYSKRGALTFLLVATFILPMSVLAIVNSLPPDYKLGFIESIVFYFISPIILHEMNYLMAIDEATVQVASFFVAIIIIILSGLIFVREEVEF
ncbi:MAG: hypothetical protein GXO43_10215 [Crenarchaeota archaeon]|nr:hypothetical protein [Thermoproteota archaeon]